MSNLISISISIPIPTQFFYPSYLIYQPPTDQPLPITNYQGSLLEGARTGTTWAQTMFFDQADRVLVLDPRERERERADRKKEGLLKDQGGSSSGPVSASVEEIGIGIGLSQGESDERRAESLVGAFERLAETVRAEELPQGAVPEIRYPIVDNREKEGASTASSASSSSSSSAAAAAAAVTASARTNGGTIGSAYVRTYGGVTAYASATAQALLDGLYSKTGMGDKGTTSDVAGAARVEVIGLGLDGSSSSSINSINSIVRGETLAGGGVNKNTLSSNIKTASVADEMRVSRYQIPVPTRADFDYIADSRIITSVFAASAITSDTDAQQYIKDVGIAPLVAALVEASNFPDYPNLRIDAVKGT